MFCSFRSVLYVPGFNDNMVSFSSNAKAQGLCFSKVGEATSRSSSVSVNHSSKISTTVPIHAQTRVCVGRALSWWEKTLKPNNMIEIHSAEKLVHFLVNAGDALVVVDFYSPGCGGCKTLHPKICQIAGLYPNVVFIQVNYEEMKTMCQSLHIHVLPFFRFYRGAEGCVCSFSCTNATIKKFKDALAKHGNEGCNLGPARGLDEKELKALASVGEISGNSKLLCTKLDKMEDIAVRSHDDFSSVGNMASSGVRNMLL
ncbi:PREDICTED: thioredoxin-like 1-2, chloroplastic [Lupinus angustifolius]|uniref:thioredoxin-like 1-2, chloroplastic n=1 Tax=Lupinus angustifolius TaxID=3871 RepID=UPI00092E85B1|nr:PREDICTED: thioredoxin-like 1-2, chloroplastic [Lupinus angustifolius]